MQEQDKTLKQYFGWRENKSAILNWLIEGRVQVDSRSRVRRSPRVDNAVADLRRRFEIKPDCKKGNVIIGLALSVGGGDLP